jgi:cleavage stimulation factor subunit 3
MENGTDAINAINAIEQLQTLTDIEGDLADTALAVAAVPPTSADPTAESSEQPQQQDPTGDVTTAAPASEEVESANDATIGNGALLQNATAMENVLEQSIPDAPVHDVIDAADEDVSEAPKIDEQDHIVCDTKEDMQAEEVVMQQTSASTGDNQPASTPQETAAMAEEAAEAIDIITADVDNPILPEEVNAANVSTTDAQPIPEPSASNTTAPSPADVALQPPAQNGDLSAQAPSLASSSAQPPAAVQQPPTPITAVAQPQPPSQPEALDTSLPMPDLPEGLTANSPSILGNPDLIRGWKEGEYSHINFSFWSDHSLRRHVQSAGIAGAVQLVDTKDRDIRRSGMVQRASEG